MKSRKDEHMKAYDIKTSTIRKDIQRSFKRCNVEYSSSDSFDNNWLLSTTNNGKLDKRLSSNDLRRS